jgi:hypothetical protein
MVETFPGVISPETIAWFKNDFAAKIDVDPVDRPYAAEDAKRIYGVDDCVLQDRRHVLRAGDEAFRRMGDILYKIVPRGTYFYMAYQRQFLPHQLHVDGVYPDTDLNYAKSAIIPLDENPNGIFQTIVWDKVMLTNEDLAEFFKEFIADSSKFEKVGEASDYLDVNHCWGGTPSIVDYMPLDGVYHYELGSIGLLDRTHVHCSSNWRKYGQGDHKDIILLHIG